MQVAKPTGMVAGVVVDQKKWRLHGVSSRSRRGTVLHKCRTGVVVNL